MAQDMQMPFDLDLNAMSVAEIDGYDQFSHQANMAPYPQPSIQQSVEGGDMSTAASLDYQDDAESNVTGAGPLPHSFGVPPPAGQGSTLTEFTKRKNWSQRIIEELKDFLYILSPDGRLLYTSPSVKELTGFEQSEVVGKLISNFIHPDDANIFVREFNESIATGNPLRFFYRFRKKDEKFIIFESHGHPHMSSEPPSFGQNPGPSFCRGFFMMARPYPTKNAALLNSFLEHKIENERLQKRIAELKREEQEDIDAAQEHLLMGRQSFSGTPSEQQMFSRAQSGDRSAPHAPSNNYDGMPPPAKPTWSNIPLTRDHLNQALAASRPDSINDKMARYEGSSHIETIEMLTGLRYREGERAKGISTGASSPTLIRGDAGIAIYVDKDGRMGQGSRAYSGSPYREGMSSEKKKKMKVADEYVCTDCGTLDSPEWRRGPNGPKTLCNACGLRWAKKEKKRSVSGTDGGQESSTAQSGGDASGASPDISLASTTPQHPTKASVDTNMKMTPQIPPVNQMGHMPQMSQIPQMQSMTQLSQMPQDQTQ